MDNSVGMNNRIAMIEQRLGIDAERYKEKRFEELANTIRDLRYRIGQLEAAINGNSLRAVNEASVMAQPGVNTKPYAEKERPF